MVEEQKEEIIIYQGRKLKVVEVIDESTEMREYNTAKFKINLHKRIKLLSLSEILRLLDSIKGVFELEFKRRGY